MNIEELRSHCLAIKGVEECTPYGDDVLVYKVMGKQFVYFPLQPKDNDFFAVMK
jgi:predicted DNA-binding protein (MmcQ/YjbR family)